MARPDAPSTSLATDPSVILALSRTFESGCHRISLLNQFAALAGQIAHLAGGMRFGDGTQSIQRHANRTADDPGLGEWRVDDALVAKLLEQTGRPLLNKPFAPSELYRAIAALKIEDRE